MEITRMIQRLLVKALRDDMMFPKFHVLGFDWPQSEQDWRIQVERQLTFDIFKQSKYLGEQ